MININFAVTDLERVTCTVPAHDSPPSRGSASAVTRLVQSLRAPPPVLYLSCAVSSKINQRLETRQISVNSLRLGIKRAHLKPTAFPLLSVSSISSTLYSCNRVEDLIFLGQVKICQHAETPGGSRNPPDSGVIRVAPLSLLNTEKNQTTSETKKKKTPERIFLRFLN